MIPANSVKTVTGSINQNKSDLRVQAKTTLAKLNDLQRQQRIVSAVVTPTKVVTPTVEVSSGLVGPNGQPLFGWSGSSGLPALTTDSNTGSSWATGERGFINNLNSVVNFILQVLLDNGVIVP